MSKLKILIQTDSSQLHTGLAETTRLIFNPLLEKYGDQYELHQVALFHSNPVVEAKWPHYPTKLKTDDKGRKIFDENDRYGQITSPEVIAKLKPDIVFGYGDPWYVEHLATNPQIKDYSLVLYLTYDGTPYPSKDQSWLKNVDKFVTLSSFSRHVIQNSMPDLKDKDIDVIYNPADIDRYCPPTEEEKLALREKAFPAHVPKDAFVLGWIGRNQWRKQIWKMYEVMHYITHGDYLICNDCGKITPIDWDPAEQVSLAGTGRVLQSPPGFEFNSCLHCGSESIQKADPIDDIYLWSHMAPEDRLWPVEALQKQYDNKDKIFYTPGFSRAKGLPPHVLPNLYKVWDAFLYLSGGEGFGNPAEEALLTGLPVIGTNYSAHGELIRESRGGIPVGGVLQPEMNSCILRMLADTGQTIKAIRDLYYNREYTKELGKNGREFFAQFSPENQAEKWHKIFQKAANPIRTMMPAVYAQEV